jgi:thiamine-phosphate pyrophosphorylase
MITARAVLARRPLLCLVTDRRRLVAASDDDDDDAGCTALLAQIQDAADAGIDLVQIREPDLSTDRLFDLVTRAVALVSDRESSTRIVVNDRLDVALAAGAHGVHLRGVSVDAPRVRGAIAQAAIGGIEFLVGRSVHGVDQAVAAAAAGGLDYLILGTMFPTASKPEATALAGVDTLRAAARACRLPILAIGGITRENARQVTDAGAAGVAAIGLFLEKPLRKTVVELTR